MSEPKPVLCRDCGVDTAPCTGRRGCRHVGRWETFYMVHDEVWEAAGLRPVTYVDVLLGVEEHDILCIGCLERRLGRPLTKGDLRPCLWSEPTAWDTPRLAAIKAGP